MDRAQHRVLTAGLSQPVELALSFGAKERSSRRSPPTGTKEVFVDDSSRGGGLPSQPSFGFVTSGRSAWSPTPAHLVAHHRRQGPRRHRRMPQPRHLVGNRRNSRHRTSRRYERPTAGRSPEAAPPIAPSGPRSGAGSSTDRASYPSLADRPADREPSDDYFRTLLS